MLIQHGEGLSVPHERNIAASLRSANGATLRMPRALVGCVGVRVRGVLPRLTRAWPGNAVGKSWKCGGCQGYEIRLDLVLKVSKQPE